MPRTLRQVSSLMLLLGFLVGIPRGAVVLCLGENGHLALERSTGAERAVAPGHAGDVCGCGDACGACRDAVLGDPTHAAALGSRGTHAIVASLAAAGSAFQVALEVPDGQVARALAATAPIPPPASPFGRSVRLRN